MSMTATFSSEMSSPLMEKAERLSREVFLGGSLRDFETGGRLQLVTLLKEGLRPDSKILDFGCGCLRGGYWLIHFVGRGCYCGIEPNRKMLQAGIEVLLEPDVLEAKQPRFDHNADFDSSVFGEKFDFFLARSVWTHASKTQIQKMLDSFWRDSCPQAKFLTSYLPASWRHPDYQRKEWIGRSHESDEPGLIHHSFKWIRTECQQRGLDVSELKDDIFNGQVWLTIGKAARN